MIQFQNKLSFPPSSSLFPHPLSLSLSLSPSLSLPPQTGTMYAELDHTGNPVPTRRPPPQQPQPVYSDVHMRDTRT